MVFLVTRTADILSRSWSSTVAGIWRSAGGSLLSCVLQCRSYSHEDLDARFPPSPSAADSLSRSGEFSPAVPTTQTFGADRPVYDRNAAHPRRKSEGFRVYRPISKLTRTALNEGEHPVRNSIRASRNVAQESCHDSPKQDFARGKELPIGSASGRDNIYLPSASIKSEAIAILRDRQQRGLSIDSYILVDILKRCSTQKDLVATREVHDYIIQSGMQQHEYVATALLNVYIKCGRLQDAHRVFDGLEMTNRNVVTWNVMIGAYAKSGCGMKAYRLFHEMKRKGFTPDSTTYLSILSPSASAGALEWVKDVHGHARKAGLESDLRVCNALVHMYAKSSSLDDARLLFDRMEKRDVITWTTMIRALAGSGCGVEAYRLFLQMKREGVVPNAFTIASILNPSASAGALEWVKDVHRHARKAGLESDLRVSSALVHMYAKIGRIDDARIVFDRMENRDVIAWNIMIGGYAESGRGVEAYRLFSQMKRGGVIPTVATYMSILNASASAGALEWVNDVHKHARRAGLESDLRVASALVHMYAKSGSIDDARAVFDRMKERDVVTWTIMIGAYAENGSIDDARLIFDRMKERDLVTWTAMIGGLAVHGYGDEALKLFEKMITEGVKPDETSFVAVLSACVHAGLVDDGRRLFSAMKQDYGIEPTIVHYNCMVDLLGRAGQLEEAKLLIGNMPVEPNPITWTALLGACRTYSNVDLGELAAEELLKLEPKDSSGYVLLSNIYAAAGEWKKVSSVRTMMQNRGVRKEPGCSWIEVDNKVHEFLVGDTSHPESKDIYTELKKLGEQLKAKGYIPDTKLVLHNIDEDEKELALCSHSEKLAIAYGLLRVPAGKAILVKKNLRVCSDCHTVTKLISEVAGREIIVRDANRFHHFKNGVCSCGDYW